MQAPKLKTNYAYLRDETLPAFGHDVVQQTTTSTFLTKGADLAAPVQAALTALTTALDETTNPTTAQTAQRDKLRAALRAALRKLATTLNLDYPGDGPALLSSGLEMVETSGSSKPITVPPTNVRFIDSAQEHCLELEYLRPPGSTVTIIRYTADPAIAEENWLLAIGGGRKRTLGPFKKGTEVHAKVAGVNASTLEPDYSAVISRIVQ